LLAVRPFVFTAPLKTGSFFETADRVEPALVAQLFASFPQFPCWPWETAFKSRFLLRDLAEISPFRALYGGGGTDTSHAFDAYPCPLSAPESRPSLIPGLLVSGFFCRCPLIETFFFPPAHFSFPLADRPPALLVCFALGMVPSIHFYNTGSRPTLGIRHCG